MWAMNEAVAQWCFVFLEKKHVFLVGSRVFFVQASKAKGQKKKVERASSNVFAMFDQKQIQEFKEVRSRKVKLMFRHKNQSLRLSEHTSVCRFFSDSG